MHKNTVPADVTTATGEPDFVVLGSIDVERGPIADLAVTPDGATIVATHYGDGIVSIIDAYALTVEADRRHSLRSTGFPTLASWRRFSARSTASALPK